MNNRIDGFFTWIYERYGQLGIWGFIVLSIFFVVIFALTIHLLGRFSGEEKTAQSKCETCKYMRKKSIAVLDCPCYEKSRWFQFKIPKCPNENESG